MTSMRPLDAAFLTMETDDEPRHLGTVFVVGPGPEGPLTAAVVRELVADRLHRLPSARRVAVDTAGGLVRPHWQERDPDLEHHIRTVDISGPASGSTDGGWSELERIVADEHGRRLDPDRPLWQLHVIEGLADGLTAVFAKVHVAALDDTTGVDLMTGLLDDAADGDETIPAVDAVDPRVLDAEARAGSNGVFDWWDRLVAPVPDQVRRSAGLPIRLTGRAVRSAAEKVPGLADTAAEFTRRTPGLGTIGRLVLPERTTAGDGREHPNLRAPRMSFNAPISPGRCVALGGVPTGRIRAVAEAVGVSTNEAVLAVLTGALRRWLDARRELPTSPTVAVIPVLVADDSGSGSHIAGLSVALPTHVADPELRLRQLTAELRGTTARPTDDVPASTQQDLAMSLPPVVASLGIRAMAALPHRSLVAPTVNLGIANVPGPRRPVTLAGRPVRAAHPVMAVSELTPVHLAVQRGADVVGVGVAACSEHVDDLSVLTGALDAELGALEGLAGIETPDPTA